MEDPVWVGMFVVDILFWLWIAKWGGAESLSGGTLGCLLLGWLSLLEEEHLKAIAWLMIACSTAWFIVGLIDPAARW